MTPEDILHASYSRNLSRETAKKTLLKFAKDRGLKDVEIWPHENGWAMRFTNNQGEPRQVVLGNVFGKARGTILSLSGNSVASQIAQLTKKYPGVDFSAAANGGIKVRSNTQSFVAKDINDVIKRMKATKPTKALSASNSVASQIAQLTKKYPKVDFSATNDGQIKVRSNTQSFVAKDINDVIKRMKAKS